tara:strand:+ start:5871 stop:6185 length:315 start_codon:yes stop_codon:yes gene_type:complete
MAHKKTVYIAMWDHKHGTDMSAHTTYDGAFKANVAIARENLPDWCDWVGGAPNTTEYDSFTDEELLECWGEITGYTEFFKVEDLELHSEDTKKEWVVDTSHIGA